MARLHSHLWPRVLRDPRCLANRNRCRATTLGDLWWIPFAGQKGKLSQQLWWPRLIPITAHTNITQEKPCKRVARLEKVDAAPFH